MEEQIAVTRAELIAAGIVRYHKHKLLSPPEMQRALTVLASDLRNLEDRDRALAIRTNMEFRSMDQWFR